MNNMEWMIISDNNILLLKNKLQEYNVKLLGYGSLYSFQEPYILSFNLQRYGLRKIFFQADQITFSIIDFNTKSWSFEAIPMIRPINPKDYEEYISNAFSQIIEYMVLKEHPAKIILNYIK